MNSTQLSNTAQKQPFHIGLRGLTSAALLLSAGAFLVQQLLIGEVIVPLVIITAMLVATALIVLSRKPWAPLVGSGVLVLLGLIYLAFTPYGTYHLTHPENTVLFAIGLVTMSAVLMGIVTGIGATWSGYVPDEAGAPRWLPAALSGLVCVVLMALLYARVTDAQISTNNATTQNSSTASMVEVRMSPFGFEKTSVTVPVNGMVHLIEAGPYYHVVANGRWNADGKAVRETESGAPLVGDVKTNGEPIMIGPFIQASTFHYFCPIHPNMNLTVTVS